MKGFGPLPPKRHALPLLILVTSLIRLVFAASHGLGVDESYMVAAGRMLSVGYFDHPPAAWYLSWGAAHLFGTEAPVAVRLPFIALFALSTWLMARLTAELADERAGFWAAVALNLSPVFGVTTGTWVLPDGPLDCALLGAALCMARALPLDGRAALHWWLGAGVCAGLALCAKYSAVLTLGGAFLYLLTSPRHRVWLRRPEPYLAVLTALLVFAPIVAWNATHGWASFAFQGERAMGLRFRPLAPFATLGGEALFVLPWIWLPMMLLAVRSVMRGPSEWRGWLQVCLAAPPIIVFALVAAWSSQRVLFHWAAPGYLMLFPLLGQAIAEHLDRAWVRRTITGTAALVLAALAVVGAQTGFDVLGGSLTAIARKDPTSEGVNWTSIRTDLSSRGLLGPGTIVGVPNWRDGGKIAIALGPDVTVICLNRDARQFGVSWPAAAFAGRDVLLLIPETAAGSRATLAPLFERVEALPDTTIRHPSSPAGREFGRIAVLRGTRLLAWPPPS